MKTCSQCHIEKPVGNFFKRKLNKDGLQGCCKDCHNIGVLKYRKTIPGLITEIYKAQKSSSKYRGHQLPAYTKLELSRWLLSQPNFNKLYNNWVASGYKKGLRPSVDRKDDYKGYLMGNIQLMTWIENNKKCHSDKRNGINNKQSKAVIRIDRDGERKEYYSIKEAGRQTGINSPSISKVCKGTHKQAGGFIWMYK